MPVPVLLFALNSAAYLCPSQCHCRQKVLSGLAQAVAQLDPSLAASASAFAKNPNTDSQGFTAAFAQSLASKPSFAQKVAADPGLSRTVLGTLPGGGDLASLCSELAPSAAQPGSEGASVYACLCQRGSSAAPPLVSCVGEEG